MTKKIKLVKNEIESAGKMPAKKRVEYNEKGLVEIFDWRTVREILSSITTERINEKLWTDRHGRERRVKYNPWLGSFTVTFTPFGEGKEAKRKARKVPKPKIFYEPDEKKQYGVLYPDTKIKDSNERLYLQSIDNEEEEETKVTESFVESVIDDATNFYLAIHGDSDEIEPTEENYLAIRGALDAIKDKSTGYRSLAKKWVKKLDEVWKSKLEQEETNENQKPAQPAKSGSTNTPTKSVSDDMTNNTITLNLVTNAGEVRAFLTYIKEADGVLQTVQDVVDEYRSRGQKITVPSGFDKAKTDLKELKDLKSNVLAGKLLKSEAKKIYDLINSIKKFATRIKSGNRAFKDDNRVTKEIGEFVDVAASPLLTKFVVLLTGKKSGKVSDISSEIKTDIINEALNQGVYLERELIKLAGTSKGKETLKRNLPRDWIDVSTVARELKSATNMLKHDKLSKNGWKNLYDALLKLRMNATLVTRYQQLLRFEGLQKLAKSAEKKGLAAMEFAKDNLEKVTKVNTGKATMKKNLRKRSDVINHLVSNCKCNELDVEILSNLSNPVLQALAENFTENSSLKDEYSEMMDYDSVNEEDGEETTIMDVATLCEKFDIDPSDEDCLDQLKEVLQDTLEQLDSMGEESVLDGDNEDLEGDSDEIESLDEDSDEDELENMEDEYTEMMDYESLNEEEYVETKKNKSCRNKQSKEVERPQKNKKVANKNKSDKGKSNKGKSDESVLNNYLGAALPSLNGDGRGDDISPDDVYESPTLGF